ncbi:MAG: NAD(P)-binding domain-containing protein [Gammaproteobacteria bacterium]|nr:NAD(P)-binding domain-containing protein [Gammaproteobacteria bacterium]
MIDYFLVFLYLAPVGLLWIYWERRRNARRDELFDLEGEENLLRKQPPVSLHPEVNFDLCIGSGACVAACPETNVLEVINGQATLVEPGSCVGHGACAKACPTQAIRLVFGTSDRGIDIPVLDTHFQTSIPGIYIAGELGGMGLIRNAIEQGRQALEAIVANRRTGTQHLDLIIVGAGPAGLSASLGAKKHGLNFVTLDQDCVGGTIAHYPRGKLVMTQNAELPLIGQFRFGEVSREELMNFWMDCIHKTELKIRENETLEKIEQYENCFKLTSSQAEYTADQVLLCLGRRGTPRKLGVEGEELSKVVYKLDDPEQYQGRRVLVVGGGDSAVEAACSIAEKSNAQVSLSYRRDSISGVKQKNKQRIDTFAEQGKVVLLLGSQVKRISQGSVELDLGGESLKIQNDDVIVCVGGNLPTKMLSEVGIEFETKFGTA